MWTKRFGVWVRSREHGVARMAEQIPQEAWEEVRRRARRELQPGEEAEPRSLQLAAEQRELATQPA